MNDSSVIWIPLAKVTARNTVQVWRRTSKNLREFNALSGVEHVHVTFPLARHLLLHGFPETLEVLRGNQHYAQVSALEEPTELLGKAAFPTSRVRCSFAMFEQECLYSPVHYR